MIQPARLSQRACAAFLAISDGRFPLSFLFRAGLPFSPPMWSRATAWGFFSLPPIACATMSAARTFMPRGGLLERFGMSFVYTILFEAAAFQMNSRCAVISNERR